MHINQLFTLLSANTYITYKIAIQIEWYIILIEMSNKQSVLNLIKIIISIALIICTIVFLFLSSFFPQEKKELFETIFKISITISLSLSLSFTFSYTNKSINNSFNTILLNKDKETIDEGWKICFLINNKLSTVISIMKQKSFYNGNKENDINKLMNDSIQMCNECMTSICIYDGNKTITISDKEKYDFMKEYLSSLKTLEMFYPIKLINTKANNDKNSELQVVLKTLVDKYTLRKTI